MEIDHINIVVSDLETSIRFFEALGFIVKDNAPLEGEWISNIVGLRDVKARYAKLQLPDDKTFLELIQYYTPIGKADPDIAKPNQIGFRHMAFRVENIEDLVKQAKNSGAQFFSDIITYERTGKKLIYFTGPDNIVLEFAQYPENAVNPALNTL